MGGSEAGSRSCTERPAGERVLRDYCVCRRRRRRQRSTRLVSEDFYLFADVCSVAWDGARRQSRLLKYELCYV